jgi:CRP-like cAMP-binding protein
MARVESSVTSVSWIPLDAMQRLQKLAADPQVSHWDPPPPDRLDRLDDLIADDAIRFANELRAFIDVEDGRITGHGRLGGSRVGRTTLPAGSKEVAFSAVALPDLCPDPELGATWVRFVQTAGGRSGVPLPRRLRRPPFVQLVAPTVWTTLALTLHADGSSRHEVVGASPFPRHWVYDGTRRLVAKSGLVDFARWRRSAAKHTPWGDEESPALMTAVESALERQLSRVILDARPSFRTLKPGATLIQQGEPGRELFLLLEGMLAVEADGEVVTEVGPGAVLGEMALLQHDVMLVSVVPARVRHQDELLTTLAETLGADRGQLAARLERGIRDTIALTVAELPAERFEAVERRLREVEGLSFARRKGRGAPPGRRTATLRAVTACRVAVVPEGLVDRDALAELAASRRRKAPGKA